jgi:hypothetical protein
VGSLAISQRLAIAALVVAVVAALCAAVGLALSIRNDRREAERLRRSQTASPHAKLVSDMPAHAGHRAYRYEVINTGQATAHDLHLGLIAQDNSVAGDVFVDHLGPGKTQEATVAAPTTVGPLRVRFTWWDEDYRNSYERGSGARVPLA